MPEGPLKAAGDGVHVAIRLTPRAAADRLIAVAATATGAQVVKATVTAPPEAGRANEALLDLLARTWRLRRSDLSLVAGASSRSKTVRVAGQPRQLVDRLAASIAALPRR